MPTSFSVPANNVVAVVGVAGYTAGSTVLGVATGQGSRFPTLSANQFYRITVVKQAKAYDPTASAATDLTIYKATGLVSDTFSGLAAIEGTTDRNYVAGDVVDVRVTAGTVGDLQGATNVLESQVGTLQSQVGTLNSQVIALNSELFLCQGRLTTVSNSPIVDGTSGTIYWTPFRGKYIALYNGSTGWDVVGSPEIPKVVPSTSGLYDVFAWNNAGVVTLEFGNAWTNSGLGTGVAGVRNQALTTQDGVLVKAADTTRRYLGTIYSSSGTASDTPQLRQVWNYYNRVVKKVFTNESAASWTDSTVGWRNVNGNANNKSYVSVVSGRKEDIFSVFLALTVVPASGNASQTALFYDSTTSGSYDFAVTSLTGAQSSCWSSSIYLPDIGIHSYYWMEYVTGGTATHYNTNSGVSGSYWC